MFASAAMLLPVKTFSTVSYLINAQGEDVVAGIRTPQQITKIGSQRWAQLAGVSEEERAAKYLLWKKPCPKSIKNWMRFKPNWKITIKDMQDMEFTVQEGKLGSSRHVTESVTGAAMVKNCYGFAPSRHD